MVHLQITYQWFHNWYFTYINYYLLSSLTKISLPLTLNKIKTKENKNWLALFLSHARWTHVPHRKLARISQYLVYWSLFLAHQIVPPYHLAAISSKLSYIPSQNVLCSYITIIYQFSNEVWFHVLVLRYVEPHSCTLALFLRKDVKKGATQEDWWWIQNYKRLALQNRNLALTFWRFLVRTFVDSVKHAWVRKFTRRVVWFPWLLFVKSGGGLEDAWEFLVRNVGLSSVRERESKSIFIFFSYFYFV